MLESGFFFGCAVNSGTTILTDDKTVWKCYVHLHFLSLFFFRLFNFDLFIHRLHLQLLGLFVWLVGWKMIVMEGEEQKKRILVGVEMTDDGEGYGGRDLLNWTIGKFAKEGDLVVAVHVCNSSMLHKTILFQNFLAEFDGSCSLKRTTLVGHLSQGKSIKKALVKEARLCNPIAVVVGVNKNTSLW